MVTKHLYKFAGCYQSYFYMKLFINVLLYKYQIQARHRMDKEINNRKCGVLLDGRLDL